MMARVMSREGNHRKGRPITRACMYNMGKISEGGNVVVASTAGRIGWRIGAGEKQIGPS